MIARKPIEEEEIQEALRRFKECGGLIKKLPMEIVPPMTMVGKKYGKFENVFENHLSADYPYPI